MFYQQLCKWAFSPLAILCPIFLCGASYSSVDCAGVPFDEKLVELMNYRNGIFIEVEPMMESTNLIRNSLRSPTAGGILIEPSEILFKDLCTNRPFSQCFQCALGSFDQDGTYAYGDFDGNLMSSINANRLHRSATNKILMRSLQSILDEVGLRHIDFFSLDTEGYELSILKGVDFSRTTFDYLLIEVYINQYDEIVAFLFRSWL